MMMNISRDGDNYVRFCLVNGRCWVYFGRYCVKVEVFIVLRILNNKLINMIGVMICGVWCY